MLWCAAFFLVFCDALAVNIDKTKEGTSQHLWGKQMVQYDNYWLTQMRACGRISFDSDDFHDDL